MANEKTVSQTGSKDHVSTAFKWFHATSANGGAMLIAAVLASYLSVYMTDTLMIPAATASLIMFVSRWGRYRPYMFAAPILLTFFSIMVWVDWGFESVTAKAVYILIMYIGYGMTVTMYTMPQMAILPAAVRDNEKYDHHTRSRMLCVCIYDR